MATLNVVIIANPWRQGVDNPTSKHHVGRELLNMGHDVLWIDGTGMRVPRATSIADMLRVAEKIRGARGTTARTTGVGYHRTTGSLDSRMRVCAPLVIPFPGSRVARRLNGWIYERAIREAGMQDAALINFLPICAETMRRHSGWKLYYCVDRWDSFDRYDSRLMAELDEECCRAADVVVVSSRDLADRCRRFNDHVEVIAHGVSHDHFKSAVEPEPPDRPADLPAGKVVGFFGVVSEWVDQELLKGIASETGGNVVVIGKPDVDTSSLEQADGVTLLGPRQFSELPRYVAHFDVGVIPFVVSDLTRAVNPIKLREMLAAGCPVVSTELPEVAQYTDLPGGCVRIGSSVDEFVVHVKDLLDNPPTIEERREISRAIQDETWASKVRRLLELIEVQS